MTTGESLFLLLAEELHFGRAAKKAFVSQQCLSDHIKRMEEAYGAALFFRKPAIALTPAGQAVRRTLLAVRNLEQGLRSELSELEEGARGTLRIGFSYSRGHLLLPPLFSRYHAQYPHVRFEPTFNETDTMAELLEHGKLDFFLGVNAKPRPSLESRLLAREAIYLAASASYLKRYWGNTYENCELQASPIDLSRFNGLPFAMNNPASTVYQILEQHMISRQIHVDTVLSISNYGILEHVCRTGAAAAFFPQMFLPSILSGNQNFPPEQRLLVFPIQDLQATVTCSLIYNRNVHYPKFALACFDMLKEVVEEYMGDSAG